MTPWRTISDADIADITRNTHRRYRHSFGRTIARTIAARRAARLRAGRAGAPTGVEVDNAVTLRAVELIGEGFDPRSAYARAAREVARKGGAS